MDNEQEEKRFLEWKLRRARTLGFHPQKEILYNHLLPYVNELDIESRLYFSEIKCNLGKSIMLKEMKPGCAVWTARLIKYIKLYGLKFSKPDHISLIKLVYELVIIPGLEPTKLHKFSTLLILLTKKKYLIRPEELMLDWRPLYDISQKVFFKSTTTLGMYHFVMSLVATFDMLVQCCKPYFPENATAEILAEMCPNLNPWNVTTREMMDDLTLYLPITLPHEKFHLGPGLWFDNFMKFWEVCHNAPNWESDMMILMALTAQNYIGCIDWEPHMPLMFTRFLRSFNLPVSYKQTQSSRQHQLDVNSIALWIVSTIGHQSSTQRHLENLLKTVETYLQSANTGRWSLKLREFLRKLPYQFVERIHRERHYRFKNSWEPKTPDAYRLTDEDVERFVKCVVDLVLQVMFSRMGISDTCVALQHLAALRPDLVIGPTIVKLMSTVDSLTEPHKYTCAMQCVVAVARPMVRGYANGYPEGPTHVIPLLFSSLPGIDPNDLKKTMVTLHFISVFCSMVPLIDCSMATEYYNDLTDEEFIVCEASAQFEDFVLQYLDRIFIFIEYSTMEFTRMEQKDSEMTKSKSETMSEGALGSTSTIVLMQTSTEIFRSAVHKFHAFVTQKILETKVAGQAAGMLCRAFSRVNTTETLRVFIPSLCNTILNLIGEHEEVLNEYILENQLLHYLLILSHIVEGEGNALIPFVPQITIVLDKILRFRCREGYTFASQTLAHMFMALSSVYPREFRSSTASYDSSLRDFLPIREWGISGDPQHCNVTWHLPSPAEVVCVQMLIDKYLTGALATIRQYINEELQLDKDTLHRYLTIVQAVLTCNTLIPIEDDPPMVLADSKLEMTPFMVHIGVTDTVTCENGQNVRNTVSEVMHRLQTKLLMSNEDDTKNLSTIVMIWEQIASPAGRGTRSAVGSGVNLAACGSWSVAALEARVRTLAVAKRAFSGRGASTGGNEHVRAFLADRALLQHELRAEMRTTAGVGPQSIKIMKALLTLSVSRYSAVRIRSQMRLHWMLSHYAYSFHAILPDLVEMLQSDPQTEHERLKGTLYVLLGPKPSPLIARHDWKVVATLWPAIIQSNPSEKPSVIRLMNVLLETINRHFATITINFTMTESCIARARDLVPVEELQNEEFLNQVAMSDDVLTLECEDNMKNYIYLVDKVVELGESGKLHWRHSLMCMVMMPNLVHLEAPYSARAVRLILNGLIHDNILVRKTAIRLTVFVLKQRKRVKTKITVDPYEVAGVSKQPGLPPHPGHRADNQWVQYDPNNLPDTAEKWNKTPFIHKGPCGYYAWQEKIQLYAPYSEQPDLDIPVEEMDEGSRVIYEFFSVKENVDKLVKFMSIEEKKGRDKFNGFKFTMFKGVFRNHGDAFLPHFMPHLERMVVDEQESNQRCAAEIIAGLIRGTKHWPFEKIQKLWVELEPIVKNALSHISTAFSDWGICFATACENIDPRRLYHLYTLLMSETLPDTANNAAALAAIENEPTHKVCARMYVIQGILSQESWRISRLLHTMLERLNSIGYLDHPFQNVRDRVGSFLTNLFEMDLEFENPFPTLTPKVSDFMAQIEPRFESLYGEDGEVITYNHSTSLNPVLALTDAKNADMVDIPTAVKLANKVMASDSWEAVMQEATRRGSISMDRVNRMMENMKKGFCPPEFVLRLEKLSMDSEANADVAIEEISRKLLQVLNISEEQATASCSSSIVEVDASESSSGFDSTKNSDYDAAMRLLKTIMKWTVGTVARCLWGARPSHYLTLAAACALGSRAGASSAAGITPTDDELARLCDTQLAVLSQVLHRPAVLIIALQNVDKVSCSKSWWTRCASIGFMQSLVFHHLPLIRHNVELMEIVEKITMRLLNDSSVEVREAAAKVLTGLLHCGVIVNENKFLDDLKVRCRRGVRVKASEVKRVADLHSAILGLSAYVSSRPYTVPARLPEVFHILGNFLNAPNPIPATIRKTIGDFKRTHHDDWQTHKLKFTEDDLELLSDLSVPPSYYA